MEPGPKLPLELCRPFDVRRCDAAGRLAAWNRWELAQWVEATRSRGLPFLCLDTDVQRRIIAAIDDRAALGVPIAIAS
ncbi:MAG TPA: hypothetical protein VHT05_02125 [Candidatus Elarobacter sp.]|jgi:hypothetical protein|nr:hypothetical protein [Candidatus Elarobacter sp.]